MSKRVKKMLLITLVLGVVVSITGCILFCRSGHVNLLGRLYYSFNLEIQTIAVQPDGSYRVSFTDTKTEDQIWSEARLRNYQWMDMLLTIYDPVVVQVPIDVSDIVAIYDKSGETGQMVVSSGLNSVPVTPTQSMVPEAGHQLVIIDFPDVEGLIPEAGEDSELMNVTVTANVDPPRAIDIKVIATGKVSVDNINYYIPLLPQVTDFSKVPSQTIPLSESIQDIELPTIDDLPETPDEVIWDFAEAADDTDATDDDTDADDTTDTDDSTDQDNTDDASDDSQSNESSGGGSGGGCFIVSAADGNFN